MMTTMLSSAAHALSDDMIEYDGRASIQMPDSEFYGLGALYRLYQASDGWVFLAAPKPNEWDQLVDAMRVHVDLQQADFATPSDRRRNDVKLSETLGAAFVTRSGDDWEGDLVEAGIACVKVAASPPEANYLSAMGRDNGYVSDAEHPVFGLHPRLAPLVEFSRSMTVSRPGCVLGQHTESVLREIGYVSDEIELMSANGVIVVA